MTKFELFRDEKSAKHYCHDTITCHEYLTPTKRHRKQQTRDTFVPLAKASNELITHF